MLFGTQNVLAVELEEGPPGFCGMRLWLDGRAIGDPDRYGTNGQLAESLRWFRRNSEKRVDPSLFRRSAIDCLDTVDFALFGRHDGSLPTSVSLGRSYGPLLLSPNFCESLDDHLIVVITHGTSQRVVSRCFHDATIVDAIVPAGSIEHVFELVEEELLQRGLQSRY